MILLELQLKEQFLHQDNMKINCLCINKAHIIKTPSGIILKQQSGLLSMIGSINLRSPRWIHLAQDSTKCLETYKQDQVRLILNIILLKLPHLASEEDNNGLDVLKHQDLVLIDHQLILDT